ncbi:DNA ligase D [Ginsengibacter hankyongi]|uniref:DNA ligase (ATP) n=1 Tax=Ginsengibacter hankyongi TaxID=2607284 RepID=A0A5J5IDD2_9BACT|nr:DNA ligase D [Ginsengibacter hankyongi]KAA9037146.1 DNA ligase D [Ginsengibacter hankyongi]
MSLTEYKKKRFFDKTPEPTGGKPTDKKLHFVIQKHNASHLHYDFRLELRGVLKSWAVPKGPSMKAGERRLAMLVEDHPWDYRDFEGIIPSGYGAGTVIVWDEGTYETKIIKEQGKHTQEHSITSQFWKGEIKFTLHGHKIKGDFKITKAKDKGENAWYLMKLKDKYATTKDVTAKDKSVLSKKTLEQVAAKPEREWESHKPAKKVTATKSIAEPIVLKKGIKAPMPASLSPMLCTLVKEPFNKDGWLYEVKWDGYRVVAFKNKNKVSLRSRSGIDYSDRYIVIRNAAKQLEGNFVIDGEVVAFNENGEVSFDAVQKANPDARLAYYVFDMVWYDGRDIMQLPLIERKEILKTITADNETVKFSDHFIDGVELYSQAQKLGLEGIVAKNELSTYEPGGRGSDWLKIPTAKRQEFVIGGWAESANGRAFRSLLFGAYNKDKQLEWIGRSGGGYKEKEMPGILKKLKALEINESPFINKILDTKGAAIHYVEPELVANFKFATWTTSGRIRKPATFLGFRYDKKATNVVREVPLSTKEEDKIIEIPKVKESKTKNKVAPTENSNWHEIEQIPITSEDKIVIEKCAVEFTNVEQEIWKGVTKAELITYYNDISPYILPQLRNRPLSLHIKPHGATAPGLYIKDMEGRQPDCAGIFSTKRKHPKAGKRNTIDYLVCNNTPTLLYLINLGCIDVNPWTSTTDDYLHPDFIVIDLDPTDDDFKKVINTALAAKKVFDKLKLKAFPKTSGKTGMHLLIPCKGFTFPVARTIAVNICKKINEQVPEISTVENTISKRGNKLFIDYNQNDEADTIAAAYSIRPAKLPTVSTPLEWKEVTSKLNPHDFTIKTIGKRLDKKGDLFKDILNEKTKLANSKILKKLL